tara:strand:+ start:483 stop:1295 length:813 start_codon:yes stop_codon:yes gene_type:complete
MDVDESGFYLETVQSIPFRTMTESLKEILVDGIFQFTSKGVSLVSMDNSKSVIVQLLLFHDQIERYRCDGDYLLGINLNTFFKVIKTITTSDSVTLQYKTTKPFNLDIIISSLEKRNRNKYTMQLLDIKKKDELHFEVSNFDTILQMQSYYFQKTCKDILNTGGSYVEILTNNDRMTFKSNDSLLASELSIYETTEGLQFKKKKEEATNDVSYGCFQLKSLITFTKCTTLCPVVTLYLMKSYPLVLQYNVAGLGIIRFCIASLEEYEKSG